MRAPSPARRMAGLSMVELMIALTIGVIVMLGVVQVFAASRAAYQLSDGLARVQENSRFATVSYTHLTLPTILLV